MNQSRRNFLLGFFSGAVVSAVTLTAYFNYHYLWRSAFGILPDKVSHYPNLAQRLKKIFAISEQDLGRADWSRFVKPTYDRRTLRLWEMMKDQELKDFLSAAVKRDYYEEKVIEADGWVLSETEIYLYNLVNMK